MIHPDQVFELIPNNSTNRAVATFIQSLAPLNSAANPLIYCLFSTNIGQTLCNLLVRLGLFTPPVKRVPDPHHSCHSPIYTIQGIRKRTANLSTGMTTSTHSSSNKPSSAGLNGGKNGAHRQDASLRPLLSNSVSVSLASSADNCTRKLSNKRSITSSEHI